METKTKDKQPEKQPLHQEGMFQDSITNLIKCGDLWIQSPYSTLHEIAGLMLTLLKKREVKEYLELIKSKRNSGTYV